MKTLLKFCLVSALYSFPVFAHAQDAIEFVQDEPLEVETIVNGDVTGIRPAALVFATFDTNGDYTVDTQELTAGQARAFAHADRDNSQHLSIIEIESWRRKALGSPDAVPGRLAFDTNLDNRITKAEFDDVFLGLFRESDANEDRVLDFAEMVNVFDMPKRRAQRDRDQERDLSQIGRSDQRRR